MIVSQGFVRLAPLAVAFSLLFSGGAMAANMAKPSDYPCYERDVKPLMDAKCVACHNQGETNLSTYELAKASSYGSLRETAVGNMPMKDRLPENEKALFAQWHEKGAPKCAEVPKAKRK